MEGNSQSKFKRICVFCGSSSGNRSVFSDAALDLGHELVKRKIELVYGGGSVGLMGLISRTVYDGGCHVLGVIPTALMPLEISGETVGELKSVSDMHERKSEMARQADAFIALPGGYGTMEEVLEMITWSQLGIHDKPVGLLNVDGYYNSLLALFDTGVAEGFIKPSARHIVLSAPTAEELIESMEKMDHWMEIAKFTRRIKCSPSLKRAKMPENGKRGRQQHQVLVSKLWTQSHLILKFGMFHFRKIAVSNAHSSL